MKRTKSGKKETGFPVAKAKYSREEYEVRILSRFIESVQSKVFPEEDEADIEEAHDSDELSEEADHPSRNYYKTIKENKYIPRDILFPHTTAHTEVRDFLTKKWRTQFPSDFYDTVLNEIPAPQGFSDISRIVPILGSRLRGEKYFRNYCKMFQIPLGESKKYLITSERLIAAAGQKNITTLEGEIRTLSNDGEKYLKNLFTELKSSLDELQKTMLVDHRRGEAVFLSILKRNRFSIFKNNLAHSPRVISGLDFTERFLRARRYFLVSVADLNIFHERYDDLKKNITRHAIFFGSEDLAHYIAILFSKGIKPPVEAFASMFVDRGGNDKFSEEKILGEFLKKRGWKKFDRIEQFELALRGMNELENQDEGWFPHYLSYMNEKLNREKRGYRNVYSLKYYSETHYKAGLFNFLRWEPIGSKLPFPKGHSLKGKYPIFDWRSTGDNPLSYYFYRFNILKVIIKNHIRESLGLPLVGDTKLNETRVYNLVKKAFPGFSVVREHSPPFLSPQRYDYYIAKLKVAIEWNGEQHYRAIEYFGGSSGFKATIKRDARKRTLSARNGVRLVELKYDMADDDILFLLKSLQKK